MKQMPSVGLKKRLPTEFEIEYFLTQNKKRESIRKWKFQRNLN